METLAFEVKTAMRCKRCNLLQPLAGLRLQLTCLQCTQFIDVKARHEDGKVGGLQYCFGGYYDVVAEALAGVAELDDGSDSHGSPVVVKRGAPACSCGAALPLPTPGQTMLRCGACRDAIPVRWADGGTRAWDPRIWCVIGDAGEGAGPAKPQTLSGTVVGCGTCGGPLDLQGKKRALVCGHCNADNFLADAVWTKLFPYPEDHRFFLVYRVDAEVIASVEAYVSHEHHGMDDDDFARLRGVIAARRIDAVLAGGPLDLAAARELVAKPIDPAQLARIDGSIPDDMLRVLVAGRIDATWLVRWSTSERPERRAITAKQPGAHLRDDDPSEVVRAALAANRPAGQLAALAADASPKVRFVVAGRRDTTGELLAALRKDADEHVKAAARANPAYTPGFFGKLFGA